MIAKKAITGKKPALKILLNRLHFLIQNSSSYLSSNMAFEPFLLSSLYSYIFLIPSIEPEQNNYFILYSIFSRVGLISKAIPDVFNQPKSLKLTSLLTVYSWNFSQVKSSNFPSILYFIIDIMIRFGLNFLLFKSALHEFFFCFRKLLQSIQL